MAARRINARRRRSKILRLFFSLVVSFLLQYLRARVLGRRPNLFADSELNRARAIRLREAALDMGGVLVKVGQFLSSRVDLLPAEYIEELGQLQDEVPAVPFEDIRLVAEAELGRPLGEAFASFEPQALAAASLGQVHAGVLPTGERVAVKIQRPDIDAIVEADLGTLRYVVRWLNRWGAVRRRVDLREILREFEQTLRMELDYIQEAHHAERFFVLFAEVDSIEIPRVYWSHTARRVLTLQFTGGIKVTDFDLLREAGISRAEVAGLVMWAYLKQVLEFGFFHADPHPGNIFVRPGPQLVFVDFGMVGELAPYTEANLRRVFLGIIRRDFDEVLAGLERLGFVTRRADSYVLKNALAWLVDTFYDMSFGELQSVDPAQVLEELHDVLFEEYVRVPANYAFLGRALGTLAGLCTSLDPGFQVIRVAEPFARNVIQGRGGLAGAVEQIGSEVVSLARTTYTLPYLTRDALTRVDRGEFDFRRQVESLEAAVGRLERVMRRMLYALLLSGVLVAGAFVFSRHYSSFAIGALLVAVVLLVAIFLPFGRRR